MNIVGAGLAGCTLAALLPNSVLYERNRAGGLCIDNDNYQEFVHIFHTDNDAVAEFINKYTTVVPHKTILKSYVRGELKQHPPKEITDEVFADQYVGYSKKMWKRDTIPPQARDRIIVEEDGFIFHEKYEGIPNFREMFGNMVAGTKIIKRDVRDGDLDGKVILTGAIDEYFDYCYGKLPYRGMQAVHYPSEIRLDADFVTFSDEKIPFQRLVDYDRLGYKGGYIGMESACDAKHYPIRDEESEKMYNKYAKLAYDKGVLLAGRLATFHYLDMDEVIEECMELVEWIKS